MARKWIYSADVQVSNAGALLTDLAGCGAFAGGTKTVASAATPEPLVADSTPCRFVWIGARVDSDGNPLNTKPVFLGDSDSQNIPVMPTNYEGVIIRIDDASKIYVRVGVDGEGVFYRIFT